jgi:hypothetical protein
MARPRPAPCKLADLARRAPRLSFVVAPHIQDLPVIATENQMDDAIARHNRHRISNRRAPGLAVNQLKRTPRPSTIPAAFQHEINPAVVALAIAPSLAHGQQVAIRRAHQRRNPARVVAVPARNKDIALNAYPKTRTMLHPPRTAGSNSP